MALSERSRSALYQGLVTVVEDEQAVQEMMSYFPARDLEEPVSKEFLRAEMADLRAEMADLRAEMADLRTDMADLHTDMADFRSEVRAEVAGLRTELHVEIAAVRFDMAQMEARLVDRINRMIVWNVGTMIAFAAVLVAAARF